jgi:predicted dehydrogenase
VIVMLKVGILGFGFMGRMHYRCWREVDGAEVVAICEADARAFQDTSRGNIAGASDAIDLEGVRRYAELSDMLRQERLDAVSITVPTFLHRQCTLEALAAGAHVLCEKPMAVSLAEGRQMIEAAERAGRVLQIGHCIRFWPEYARVKEILDSGVYGRLLAASFQRLAATAAKQPASWFMNEELSGGVALDLHIHDTDFVQYLFGMPRAVQSWGVTAPGGGLLHLTTRYRYEDPRLVTAEGGWAMMPSYPFQMRFHMILQRATIEYDLHSKPTLRVCPAEGEVIMPECAAGDGYSQQIAHFARRVRGENVPAVIGAEDAWNSLRIVAAERESVRLGREVCIEG